MHKDTQNDKIVIKNKVVTQLLVDRIEMKLGVKYLESKKLSEKLIN